MAFRAASGVMAALFLFAALVQYNDPDPIRWAAIYLLGSLVALQAARGQLRSAWAPGLLGATALVWAVVIGRTAVGRVSFSELFESVGMKTDTIEVGRESLGLLILAAWMIVLALHRPTPPSMRR
jgi:hypothetical protein